MTIRAKLLLVLLLCGIGPTLLLSVGYYRSATRTVAQLLRADVSLQATHLTNELSATLAAHEADLRDLADTPELSHYLSAHSAAATVTTLPAGASVAADANGPEAALLRRFLRRRTTFLHTLLLVAPDGQPLVGVEPNAANYDGVQVKTGGALPARVELSAQLAAARDGRVLRAPNTRAAAGLLARYFVPVRNCEAAKCDVVGALVAELRLDPLFAQCAAGLAPAPAQTSGQPATCFVVITDRGGQIVYPADSAPGEAQGARPGPEFTPIAAAMAAGASATGFFTTPADGQRWLVAYRPVADTELAAAVAGNYTAAAASLNRTGLICVGLSILTALAAAVMLTLLVQRTSQRINRVAEAATQIAAGHLDQQLDLHTGDETNQLAQSFNRMSDKLREQIAREAENRQFQSFLRISAMLTHDLKNAITGLAMLVNNMERQFHHAEFRADAIESLRAATDKLRALVARLSEPIETLSGEYRHSIRETDLVPLVRRALAQTAEPMAALHQLEAQVPATLSAPVDAERIERVLENLILNALEAMGTRAGRLTVAAGATADQHVFISVSDTGVGMTEEFMRTKLFRPFATTKNRGIGLGLYTCREIVRAHGGDITAESEAGAGTCFRVVLPSQPVIRSRPANGRNVAAADRHRPGPEPQ